MTENERLEYLDVALRIHKIQVSREILEITVKCLDLVDKSKGKATLDQVLLLKPLK
jgi:hypothetical protein